MLERGKKLHLVHKHTLERLESYLTDRTPPIVVTPSGQFLHLSCGIPQGSFLGPMTFSLYTFPQWHSYQTGEHQLTQNATALLSSLHSLPVDFRIHFEIFLLLDLTAVGAAVRPTTSEGSVMGRGRNVANTTRVVELAEKVGTTLIRAQSG